jgi:hypothetical protein
MIYIAETRSSTFVKCHFHCYMYSIYLHEVEEVTKCNILFEFKIVMYIFNLFLV